MGCYTSPSASERAQLPSRFARASVNSQSERTTREKPFGAGVRAAESQGDTERRAHVDELCRDRSRQVQEDDAKGEAELQRSSRFRRAISPGEASASKADRWPRPRGRRPPTSFEFKRTPQTVKRQRGRSGTLARAFPRYDRFSGSKAPGVIGSCRGARRGERIRRRIELRPDRSCVLLRALPPSFRETPRGSERWLSPDCSPSAR